MMKKHGIVLLFFVVGIVFTGCVEKPIPPWETTPTLTSTTIPSFLKTKPVNLSGVETEKLSFLRYYSLNPLDVELKVSPYTLPLETRDVSNYDDFSRKIRLSSEASSLLGENGFVVVENPFNLAEEDITEPYKKLKDREIPIFITSDSLLHLYHIQFDETLRQIEEREFYDRIWEISSELLDDSMGGYNRSDGDLREAYERNVAYLSVALELLRPKEDQICPFKNEWDCLDAYFTEEDLEVYRFEIPGFVREEVENELDLIEKHEGFSESPVFIYGEDYSQYVPRGHYTRSEKLENYFRALMWYGRISMLLKGTGQVKTGESCVDFPPCTALISTYDARIQTMQASLMASKFAEDQELRGKWDRIYSVTAFYVGLSDDLGPYEYIEAMDYVFGDSFNPDDLTEEYIGRLKAKLAEYRTPEIYGGTGDCVIYPPFTAEQADECLEASKGFRLMGQRFIPDSYMFSNLVGQYTGVYIGDREPKPFTLVISGAGRPIRGFPRGLDVMALLGSERAGELLDELDDSSYRNYTTQYRNLEEEFNSFTVEEWNRNLYWSWLFTLKPLLKEFPEGYPTFMQSKAWQDKELTTALASWTELRHDTILYAKQSYTMVERGLPMPEKPVVGYVEPVPEFYNRLLSLTRMTSKGLDDLDVLDDTAKDRLLNLERILEKLVLLSERELENEELEEEDYEFIKYFGEQLNYVIEDVDDKAKKTTIVADVHTDGNTNQVLEEGVGYVNLIVVAYRVPDGRILVGAGPVMSYYEFKHPMEDRLTDEKWRELLEENPPEKPEWVSNFSV